MSIFFISNAIVEQLFHFQIAFFEIYGNTFWDGKVLYKNLFCYYVYLYTDHISTPLLGVPGESRLLLILLEERRELPYSKQTTHDAYGGDDNHAEGQQDEGYCQVLHAHF